ncbi:TraR/DksA family transcriptional regulator [Leekyejoonella antrihumi]|uniref:DNA-binding protein n=1 Tax=Leekyejoonella antrihumi TaxID=1660198 RepID=A0A563DY81_9MICO|nr:TraR/DksA C4-type zinc finger protein [Leekyejoonella antrihumi]TWP35176.1 DNA-binding protein [Leekyejoonella antrihumi]
MPAKKKPAASTSGKKATASRGAATKRAASKKVERAAKKVATATTTKAAAGKVSTTRKKTAAPRRGTDGADQLVVREDESPWTAKELGTVRDELEQDVTRLTSELTGIESDILGLMTDSGDGAGDDQADVGTKTFEREHEFTLAQNSRDLLLQSKHALERIEDGTYGTCENCGNPIGKMRLQAFPRATLCLTCKQKQERH